MLGSRRFLLVLVLASLTGVLLLQAAMDGRFKTFKGSEPLLKVVTNISILPHHLKAEALFVKHPSRTTTFTTTSQKALLATSSTKAQPATSSLKALPAILPKNPLALKQTLNTTLSRVQIRTLAKNAQLVSRQDRLQDILNRRHMTPTLDPMRSLRPMLIMDKEKVKRIIVLTYFRSGSSFFGDILQQNWKTFYHFEPLHSMTYDKRVDDDNIEGVFNLFDSIFQCNFSSAERYIDWARQPRNQFLFAHNLFLWVTCHGNPKSCFKPSFMTEVCIRAPLHIAKVTRLHMRHLRSYLEHREGFKVVYLSRDPRGILSSRWSLDWCNGTNCSDPGVLCREMDQDIRIFEELRKERPSDFIQVRYEDLSLNPEAETKRIFDLLNLPFSTSVKKFLKTHTMGGHKADDTNPYSTRRNSSSMVSSWMERFTFQQVLEVQKQCGQVLHMLNHSLVTTSAQLPYPKGKPKTTPKVVNPPSWRYNKNPLAQKYLAHKKGNYSRQHNNTNIQVHKSVSLISDNYKTKWTKHFKHKV